MRKIIVRITKDEEIILHEWAERKGFPVKSMPAIAMREGIRCYIMEKYPLKAPDPEEITDRAEGLQPE
jgi:hypothetical protein